MEHHHDIPPEGGGGQASYEEDVDGLTADVSVPNEADLALLCLDYLRDLRRAYPADVLRKQEGIHADYLTMAIWALNRAFDLPMLEQQGNDCWMDARKQNEVRRLRKQQQRHLAHGTFPPLAEMQREILYQQHLEESGNAAGGDQKKEEDYEAHGGPAVWYEYDDNHPSNGHRFYPQGGLASGPHLQGPLMLSEICSAGLVSLGARTRQQAEEELIQSTLFEQFVDAVKAKGFFDIDNRMLEGDTEEEMMASHDAIYEERYRKVVAKFRAKLASKAADDDGSQVGRPTTMVGNSVPSLTSPSNGDALARMAADQLKKRREVRIQRNDRGLSTLGGHVGPSDDGLRINIPTPRNFNDAFSDVGSAVNTDVSAASYVKRTAFAQKLFSDVNSIGGEQAAAPSSVENPADLEEAERLKSDGNAHMQKKEYQAAADCYTAALKLSTAGPHSHVYFSNRAAALVSMRKFQEAILDSERSLALKPNYGKAHARLGLAHFLLGNYRQAIEAYTVALKYEPDNKSSKSYLEKAAKRLAENGQKAENMTAQGVSFSVVSEMGNPPNVEGHQSRAQKQAAERDAEKFKTKGNALMANRDYALALDAYNQAIRLSRDGPQSHVYYSNRAAAFCYLERYNDAEQDSIKSLSLEPTYGKAHARLGLSRFFLQKYAGAVEAYTDALKYDPDNAASKSYLAKAKAKLNASVNKMSSGTSGRVPAVAEAKVRRLMDDENMQLLTKRAMADPSRDLLDDPEIRILSKKAMAAMKQP